MIRSRRSRKTISYCLNESEICVVSISEIWIWCNASWKLNSTVMSFNFHFLVI